MNYPVLTFSISLLGLWLFARLGAFFRTRVRPLGEDEARDFGVVTAAALTLLGLLIGFSFSMAVNRYDQRKQDEEMEANAIGTEYIRADLLPPQNAAIVRELLRKYVDQRVLFYEAEDEPQLRAIDSDTARLQAELWSQVRSAAEAQPTPLLALAMVGMNDVLNAESSTEAAWRNHVPTAAWALLAAIAILCNLLIGYTARSTGWVLAILPLAVGISLVLIADIDSPRKGVIRVAPQNLLSLSQSLRHLR